MRNLRKKNLLAIGQSLGFCTNLEFKTASIASHLLHTQITSFVDSKNTIPTSNKFPNLNIDDGNKRATTPVAIIVIT
jgi:hypothetical protein